MQREFFFGEMGKCILNASAYGIVVVVFHGDRVVNLAFWPYLTSYCEAQTFFEWLAPCSVLCDRFLATIFDAAEC